MNVRDLLSVSLVAVFSLSPSAQAKRDVEPIEFYSPAQRSSTFDGCKDIFPDGKPIPLNIVGPEWKVRGLCSDMFAVLYSGKSKTPLVVVEKLDHAQLANADREKRSSGFFPDPRLPDEERAALSDYKNSQKDRGHLAAAGNAPTSNAMAQTFALSNMVPQDQKNNRLVWNKLEQSTRKYVKRAKGNVFVFSGPLFGEGYATIGRNKVYVPTHLFKLVFDEETGKTWAHVIPNSADAQIGNPISYQELVKMLGWPLMDDKKIFEFDKGVNR